MCDYCIINIGDSLSYGNNKKFSTKDRDNDEWNGNCAVERHGAWWYKKCGKSNLNGMYYRNEENDRNDVVRWYRKNYHYFLKQVKMKIMPNV